MLPDLKLRPGVQEAGAAAFEKLPRELRRDIKKAGAEELARAEIGAAVEEATAELTPLAGREAAEAIALAFVPGLIAGAVLLRAHMAEIERLRQAKRQACATPLPADATPEARALHRLARRRIEMLTQYPTESKWLRWLR